MWRYSLWKIILQMIFFRFDSSWIARGLKIMVNALGERRSKVLPIFTSTSKWTQSHLILLQPNCIYSFLQGKSKIEFWREDFLRLFQRTLPPRLPFDSAGRRRSYSVQKIATAQKFPDYSQQWAERYNFCNLASQMSTSKIYASEKSKASQTLNFKDYY